MSMLPCSLLGQQLASLGHHNISQYRYLKLAQLILELVMGALFAVISLPRALPPAVCELNDISEPITCLIQIA
jgi:hypothetical protein